MKTSQYLIATVKETPADAELISHQLMLRAGLIRRLASGLYTWLPLGFRVLHKITQIVREEMDHCGALEMLMPTVQPAELWQESERWQVFGPELLKMNDRHQRPFCLGPTHEEVITDIMRREIKSYKQLPLNFYQIQTKFRDEVRPRFGVMRAREFTMKDAYSFHIDSTSLSQTYDAMYECYQRIFSRLSLNFRAVLADTGSIGGNGSHEFQVLADAGEDTLVYSTHSDYAANIERAHTCAATTPRPAAKHIMELVATPGQYTIDAISQYLKVKPEQTVKTLLVEGTEQDIVALVIRGDHQLNPLKAAKLPQVATPLNFASEAKIMEYLGCSPGSIGPVKLDLTVIADYAAAHCSDFVCGANEDDQHYQYVNWGRDVDEPEAADLRFVIEGEASPDGQGELRFCRGIEVGHIFQLGTKYSEAMQATVLDEMGKTRPIWMGCYGIGISRLVAAVIEQHHDEKGIIWPQAIAPFDVALIPINQHKSEQLCQACVELYTQLQQAGLSVLYDDRQERAGILFADMDLIGIPHRLVLSDKLLAQNSVEYKAREATATQSIARENIVDFLLQYHS